MWFFRVILSSLVASTLVTGSLLPSSPTVAPCFAQRGIALAWVEPFSFCGTLSVIIEGTGKSPNYFPMSMYSGCMEACASADLQQVQLKLQWCSDIQEPMLMLPTYIRELDITVQRHNDMYKFYGCAKNYRTMFEIVTNITCIKSSCQLVMSHVGQRSEMPRPFGFQKSYTMDEPGPQLIEPTGDNYGRSLASKVVSKYWIFVFLTASNLAWFYFN
ncbi:hypothetical protein ZHAS_00008879 [Anopheles sinensis]|uniref:Uncharacterized protein n=1 Tax=Anopheles sinensis TaxID=74873 RepID=A0A084VTJ2_ANOSI|nr:hypothetical protein ZHAS_00008879 [Anopheles sinensis]